MATMKAWSVVRPGAIRSRPLELQRREIPTPGRGELLVRVSACGVCRTDLHVTEGDLPVHRAGVVPGHEIVGHVAALGPATARFAVGDRVGIAWLRSTCGTCRYCARGEENLCVSPRFTGWDDDGGYAEWAVVDERYAYRIPEVFGDAEAAPLLCAGIIGYRALRRAACPPGGRLGIWGFGGSAHIAAQVAHHERATVHVRTRDPKARELAGELGAATVGESFDPLPEPLDAAILFAPAGELVPVALAALGRGGTLAVAGIYLTDIPGLRYQEHLFYERQLRSVTANTRQDGEEFLALAAEIPIHVQFTPYPLVEADRALLDLAEDRVVGAAVLQPDARPTQ